MNVPLNPLTKLGTNAFYLHPTHGDKFQLTSQRLNRIFDAVANTYKVAPKNLLTHYGIMEKSVESYFQSPLGKKLITYFANKIAELNFLEQKAQNERRQQQLAHKIGLMLLSLSR